MFLRTLIPNMYIYGYLFENEGVSDNTSESVFFSISGEVWLYKAWENRRIYYLLHG